MWGYTFFMSLLDYLKGRLSKHTKVADIKKKVDILKEEALEEGIPQLINRLYFSDIRYYPGWINIPDGRRYVPEAVTLSTSGIQDSKEKVEFTLNGHQYSFLHNQPNLNIGDTSYLLELWKGGERVMAIRGHLRYINSIEAYIKGDWVEDFKKLEKEIAELEIKEEKYEAENPEEVQKLKKNFGLE